ncbi:hypothetical protein L6R52_34895 [Myxococcota bacterium]|nr:hypothetical protein [Myxococcota bacterium]
MSARVCAAGLLVALTACTERVVVTFEPPSADERYSLFVAIDASGAPVRTGDVWGVEDGRVVFGGDPRFALEPGEDAVVVSFTADALRAISPGFLGARETELRVRVAPPPEAPRLAVDDDPTLVDAALPDALSVRTGTGRSDDATTRARLVASLRATLTLTLPIDPEHCRPEPPIRFVPYGATAQLFPSTLAIPGEPSGQPSEWWRKIRSAHVIDEDLVFAATAKVLFLVERGRAPSLPPTPGGFDPAEPAPTVFVDDLGTFEPVATVTAIEPTQRTPGEHVVVVAGFDEGRLVVWELSVSRRGIVVLGRVPIEGDAFRGVLFDVAVDGAGNTVITGRGLMLARPAGAAAFRRVLAPDADGDLRRIVATSDAARPHFVGEDTGQLFLGDALAERWEIFLRGDRLNDRRYYGLAADDGELWAVGPKGTLFRSLEGVAFAPLEVQLPPSAYACGSAAVEGGLPRLTRTMTDVQLDDDAAYLLLAECSGVLRVRRSDLCATTIAAEGTDIAARETGWGMRTLAAGQLFVYGNLGELLVADLRRP